MIIIAWLSCLSIAMLLIDISRGSLKSPIFPDFLWQLFRHTSEARLRRSFFIIFLISDALFFVANKKRDLPPYSKGYISRFEAMRRYNRFDLAEKLYKHFEVVRRLNLYEVVGRLQAE